MIESGVKAMKNNLLALVPLFEKLARERHLTAIHPRYVEIERRKSVRR